jgi:hypothetical protein
LSETKKRVARKKLPKLRNSKKVSEESVQIFKQTLEAIGSI